ncbi:hypothetical protein DAEQUDRAFT_470166 [Daedalea quercina L-15889]|uniref:Uncharacterized protein n=1 Tax=Daedalea quercina L-15889 TaxID=1314783 RepID=A0A165TH83_9APHY|nr:hypothetical protein DAEQUDRAFT_470166 [Daedalea quercina L-15889]
MSVIAMLCIFHLRRFGFFGLPLSPYRNNSRNNDTYICRHRWPVGLDDHDASIRRSRRHPQSLYSKQDLKPAGGGPILANLLYVCRRTLVSEYGVLTLVVLICNVLADVVVIVATWAYIFKTVRLQGWRRWSHSIAWLLLRDGTIYFLAVFCLNLIVCIIGIWFGNLVYLVNLNPPLQLILISRLLINLREASQDDIYIGSLHSSTASGRLPSNSVEPSTLRFDHADLPGDEDASGGEQSITYGVHHSNDAA